MCEVTICYIGGGSKAWAKKLMGDLLCQGDVSGILRLYDVDIEAAIRNKKYFEALIEKNKNIIKSKWTCEVYKNIDEALTGADFVVISILPGTFDDMEIDVHLPEKYGIYQSVGDTTGPGGFSRALRTIPIYREFAKKIKENCPNAWVITYTNPMAICVATLYREFPEIKAFGCCHEVFKIQTLLKEIYQLYTGDEREIDRREIKINVQGINHFTWVTEAKYGEIDLMPMFAKFVKEQGDKGYLLKQYRGDNSLRAKYFACLEKVKFDLFKRFGVIAAAGDRHLAEFLPSSYLNSPEEVVAWGFNLTPVSYRKKEAIEKVEKTIRQIEGKEELKIELSGEEGVDQIRAILGYHVLVTNVNLPNKGQLPDLPKGAIVETNAVFSSGSVKPVYAGKMNPNIKAIVTTYALNQMNLIEAYFTRDKQALFETFYNDPSVARLKRNDAKALFNELIDGTKNNLEKWVIENQIV